MPTGPDEAILVEMCKDFDALTLTNKKVLEVSLLYVLTFNLLSYELIKDLQFTSILLNFR